MAKGTLNVVIAGNSELLNKELQAVERRLKRFGNGLKSIGDSIFTSVGVPFIAAGAAGVKAASDFESSLSKIKGLVGIAGEDLKQLENAALRLGPQMGKSATEAAEALFFITSAGLKGKDAIDVLEMSLKASAAGLGEVSTIADLATSVMNAYGAENVSAANATDTLTAAVREGKLQADTLAGAVSAVLPIASAMGVQFNEVGAAFAAMSRTGTSADEAATQLKGILSSLLKPTVEAEKALSEMGLSSEMLREQIKEEGLLSVLELLNNRFDGNTAATAKVFGNVRALTGVLDLMGKNADGTRQIFERMNAVAGDTDKAFGAAAETTEFKFNQALAKLNSAAIKLGGDLIPVVTEIISTIQLLVDKFLGLDDGTRKAIVSSLKWITIISGGMSVVGRMVNGIAGLLSGLRAIGATTLFANIVSGFKAIITTGTTANIVIRSLGIGLKGLLLNPVTLAIGAAALAFEALDESMGKIVISEDKQLTFLEKVALGWREFTGDLEDVEVQLKKVGDAQNKNVKLTQEQIDKWKKYNPHLREGATNTETTTTKTKELTEAQKKLSEEVKKVYSELRGELEFLTAKQELYGESLDEEKIASYESAIDSLLRLGFNPMSKTVQNLKKEMEELYRSMMPILKPLEKIQSGSERFGIPKVKREGKTDKDVKSWANKNLGQPAESAEYSSEAKRFGELESKVEQFGERYEAVMSSLRDTVGSFFDYKNQRLESSYQKELQMLRMSTKNDEAFAAAKARLDEKYDAKRRRVQRQQAIANKAMGIADIIVKTAQAVVGALTMVPFTPFNLVLAKIVGGLGAVQLGLAAAAPIPALAQGGMTTGPGMAMIGDNASGKEFVIPFERMGEFARQAMGGNNVNVAGEFRVKGSDLILVLERANRITSAKRGYGLNG